MNNIGGSMIRNKVQIESSDHRSTGFRYAAIKQTIRMNRIKLDRIPWVFATVPSCTRPFVLTMTALGEFVMWAKSQIGSNFSERNLVNRDQTRPNPPDLNQRTPEASVCPRNCMDEEIISASPRCQGEFRNFRVSGTCALGHSIRTPSCI